MRLDDDQTRMEHIVSAAEEAVGYVTELTFRGFEQNRMAQHAVVRCIEIVGEASSRLSPTLKSKNVDVPWVDIIGMRNRIVHAYFDIDVAIVWKTATEDIPALLPAFRRIARELAER